MSKELDKTQDIKYNLDEEKSKEDKKDDLDDLDDEENDVEVNEDKTKEELELAESEFSLKDELGSLLEAEGLTDDFKSKAVTIFESAVNEASKEWKETFKAELQEQYENAIETKNKELEESADEYVTEIAENWISENEETYRTGIKAQSAISFMEKMTDLFVEHHIVLSEDESNIMESKVEESEEKVSLIKSKLEESVDIIKDLAKELEITKYTKNLSEVKSEKINSLAESIEFEDSDSFVEKLKDIEENYFGLSSTVGDIDDVNNDSTGVVESEKTEKLDPTMAKYVQSISKN